MKVPVEYCFYLSVRDRITKLLNSDIRNFFFYEKFRYKGSDENYVEDIYDGSTYKSFNNSIPSNCRLIFLQVCWDGASMFTFGKSNQEMWPLIYSIVNLPPSLRDKLHIGECTSFYLSHSHIIAFYLILSLIIPYNRKMSHIISIY